MQHLKERKKMKNKEGKTEMEDYGGVLVQMKRRQRNTATMGSKRAGVLGELDIEGRNKSDGSSVSASRGMGHTREGERNVRARSFIMQIWWG